MDLRKSLLALVDDIVRPKLKVLINLLKSLRVVLGELGLREALPLES